VQDDTIKQNKPFMAFLPRMQRWTRCTRDSVVFSAPGYFFDHSKQALELSQAIVEDDSGIPVPVL